MPANPPSRVANHAPSVRTKPRAKLRAHVRVTSLALRAQENPLFTTIIGKAAYLQARCLGTPNKTSPRAPPGELMALELQVCGDEYQLPPEDMARLPAPTDTSVPGDAP